MNITSRLAAVEKALGGGDEDIVVVLPIAGRATRFPFIEFLRAALAITRSVAANPGAWYYAPRVGAVLAAFLRAYDAPVGNGLRFDDPEKLAAGMKAARRADSDWRDDR